MLQFSAHEVHCFYSFSHDFKKGVNVTLGDLVNPENNEIADEHWIPNSIQEFLRLDLAENKVFEEVQLPVKDDLYIPVRDLISGHKQDRCKVYSLSRDALDLFHSNKKFLKYTSGADKTPFSLIMLCQTKAVVKRLGKSANDLEFFWGNDKATGEKCFVYPVNLSDIVVYSFSTNHAVIKVTLSLRVPKGTDIDNTYMTEFISEAGRIGSISWFAGLPNIPPDERAKISGLQDKVIQSQISEPLERVIFSLLTGRRKEIKTTNRVYTYSYAKLSNLHRDSVKGEMLNFATLASRQFTSDYDINHEIDANANISLFNNIVHFLKREGGVTVLSPFTGGKLVSFLDNYSGDTLRQSYLPLVVLNIHQLTCSLDLLEKANNEVCEIIRGGNKEQFESLIKAYSNLKNELTILKGIFRFRQVSQVSMHNNFNLALRESFKLADIEQQLDEMIDEFTLRSERALKNHELDQQQKFRKKYNWISIMATAVIAGVLFMEFVNTGINLLSNGFDAIDLLIMLFCAVVVFSGYRWGCMKVNVNEE